MRLHFTLNSCLLVQSHAAIARIMSLRKRSSQIQPPQLSAIYQPTSGSALSRRRITFRQLVRVVATLAASLIFSTFLARLLFPRYIRIAANRSSAQSSSSSPPPPSLPHRCTGSITIGLPVPTSNGARILRVRVGDCNFLFAPDSTCPSTMLSRVSQITRLKHLPCTNLSVQLTARTPLLTLRAFGIRSRRHTSLPFHVTGALIPYHVSPYVTLETPDDRPYTWKTTIPSASTCTRGNCRWFITAMLLSYLSGCGPLHSESLWYPNYANDDNSNVIENQPSDKVLLAFTQNCNSNSTDVIAYDLLLRYLRVSCEVPRQFQMALSKASFDDGVVSVRARQLQSLLRNEGRWWWRRPSRRNEICRNGVQAYQYRDEQWVDAMIPQWERQFAAVESIAVVPRRGGVR